MLPLLLLASATPAAWAAQPKNLAVGHVPPVVAHRRVTPQGNLAATNRLQLAIGLPLRNQAELARLLKDLYNPASPVFHHYLTPAEFTSRFGPTASDYARVTAFAAANHLRITATSSNRMLLAVNGAAADVERAFHVRLNTYRHPREPRNFFAPDTEPTVATDLPVQDVSGLSDYVRPHPCLHFQQHTPATPQAGSAPGGGYLGGDFRQAYVPGTTLVGAGQTVGLFQLDGYDSADIAAYTPVLADGLDPRDFIRIAADQHWVVTPDAGRIALLAAAVAPGVGTVTPLSASRARLLVEGAASRALLGRLVPLDLEPAAFPVGRFAQTGVHHVGGLLYRAATDRYEFFALRSFAASTWDMFADAALSFGYDVRIEGG